MRAREKSPRLPVSPARRTAHGTHLTSTRGRRWRGRSSSSTRARQTGPVATTARGAPTGSAGGSKHDARAVRTSAPLGLCPRAGRHTLHITDGFSHLLHRAEVVHKVERRAHVVVIPVVPPRAPDPPTTTRQKTPWRCASPSTAVRTRECGRHETTPEAHARPPPDRSALHRRHGRLLSHRKSKPRQSGER